MGCERTVLLLPEEINKEYDNEIVIRSDKTAE